MGTQIVSSSEVASVLAADENKHGFILPKQAAHKSARNVVLQPSMNQASQHSTCFGITVATGNITSVDCVDETYAELMESSRLSPKVAEDYRRFLRNVH